MNKRKIRVSRTYIKDGVIAFNEGRKPFNFYINLNKPRMLYIYFLGKRWSKLW